jgi:serine/threonine protein kinase
MRILFGCPGRVHQTISDHEAIGGMPGLSLQHTDSKCIFPSWGSHATGGVTDLSQIRLGSRTRSSPQVPGSSDVWALGVTLYGMLTGRRLYVRPGDDPFTRICGLELGGVLEEKEVRAKNEGRPMEALSDAVKDLISGCLHPDMAGRLTIEVRGGCDRAGEKIE